MYKINSRVPRTDPRGMPNRMIFCVDRAEPRRTHSTLLAKYDCNQSKAAPLIPKETFRSVSKMS